MEEIKLLDSTTIYVRLCLGQIIIAQNKNKEKFILFLLTITNRIKTHPSPTQSCTKISYRTVFKIGIYTHKHHGYGLLKIFSEQQLENIESTAWDPNTGDPILAINNMNNEMEEDTIMCWLMEDLLEIFQDGEASIRPTRTYTVSNTEYQVLQPNFTMVEDSPGPYKISENN